MNGTVKIGGYKIPVIALLAAVVGVAVLMVLRAKGGKRPAAAGPAPVANQLSGVYGGPPSTSLANLSTLQTQLEGEMRGLIPATPMNPAPNPVNPAPTPIAPAPIAPTRIANQGGEQSGHKDEGQR